MRAFAIPVCLVVVLMLGGIVSAVEYEAVGAEKSETQKRTDAYVDAMMRGDIVVNPRLHKGFFRFLETCSPTASNFRELRNMFLLEVNPLGDPDATDKEKIAFRRALIVFRDETAPAQQRAAAENVIETLQNPTASDQERKRAFQKADGLPIPSGGSGAPSDAGPNTGPNAGGDLPPALGSDAPGVQLPSEGTQPADVPDLTPEKAKTRAGKALERVKKAFSVLKKQVKPITHDPIFAAAAHAAKEMERKRSALEKGCEEAEKHTDDAVQLVRNAGKWPGAETELFKARDAATDAAHSCGRTAGPYREMVAAFKTCGRAAVRLQEIKDAVAVGAAAKYVLLVACDEELTELEGLTARASDARTRKRLKEGMGELLDVVTAMRDIEKQVTETLKKINGDLAGFRAMNPPVWEMMPVARQKRTAAREGMQVIQFAARLRGVDVKEKIEENREMLKKRDEQQRTAERNLEILPEAYEKRKTLLQDNTVSVESKRISTPYSNRTRPKSTDWRPRRRGRVWVIRRSPGRAGRTTRVLNCSASAMAGPFTGIRAVTASEKTKRYGPISSPKRNATPRLRPRLHVKKPWCGKICERRKNHSSSRVILT
jgi:hypothetical protein